LFLSVFSGSFSPDISPRLWKGGALQAAEKPYNAVILSAAKDLALSIFKAMRDSSFARLRTAAAPQNYSAFESFRSLFSPAEIVALATCWFRAPRSLRRQAARGAEQGNYWRCLVTAGLKPRPSKRVVRNPC
jgi:hypothetical protein